jgi:hypothetical protein
VSDRTVPDRLRWLADQLEERGDDELVRYGAVSMLSALALEMESGA